MKLREPIGWPEGTTSALCMTFDLDAETMWTSRDPENAHRPVVMSQGRYDVEEALASVLDFLDSNGISTTFFVPSDVALAHRYSVQEIVHRGHEVASHGTDHVPIDGATAASEREMLTRSTEVLAEVAGVSPVGYRAPMYSVTEKTWDIMQELGYQYSSNMMDTVHPYLHASGVVELPVHWALDDGVYFLTSFHPPNYRKPTAPSRVAEIWTEELAAIARAGGVTTLTLHPQLIGRPARMRVLQQLLDSAIELGAVWLPTGRRLAEHVRAQHAGGAMSAVEQACAD
jgi:peptidoglycan/xylan/chitin deacetylase (PgdA/CDA1 family)